MLFTLFTLHKRSGELGRHVTARSEPCPSTFACRRALGHCFLVFWSNLTHRQGSFTKRAPSVESVGFDMTRQFIAHFQVQWRKQMHLSLRSAAAIAAAAALA